MQSCYRFCLVMLLERVVMVTDGLIHPSVTSDKALVRLLRNI
jgi:hypothetical protein